MNKVVVVGGGWSGCAAALEAKKAGAQVVLLERTDMLLGTGLVGGIMRNNGRFTVTEEVLAMGGGELFLATDRESRHRNIEFPGHQHATLYDVSRIEPAVRRLLQEAGIEIHLSSRFKDLVCEGQSVKAVIFDEFHGQSDLRQEADVFVDATGSAGPMGNCSKYGNGCAMCVLRCPTFGPRVSLAGKAGIKEIMGMKEDGTYGAMSGSCKLHKDSLSSQIQKQLDETGIVVVPIPAELQKSLESLGQKACQQYALKEFAENIILLDTGHAKLMTSYYPLHILRQVPGFANARFEDPYAGGIGNSIRYLALSPRTDTMKVEGLDNVFCGGEKAGLLVGHTEAILTGSLAGRNAARFISGRSIDAFPTSLACGFGIGFVREAMQTDSGLKKKYTFSGSILFDTIKAENLYTTDITKIAQRVREAGMEGFFSGRD